MSFVAALKNLRRRAVESVLQSVGVSEATVDEEYDKLYTSTRENLDDLNECGGALSSVLKNQKILFSEARELATSVSAVYERNATEVETWPPDTVKLKSHEAAAMWRDKWDRIHNITRSSAAIVCCDEALDPIRNTLNTCAPTLEQDNKDRAVLITDYDSFRRRLKGMETKRETKGSEINQGTLGELNKEISHFQAKVQAGGKEYDELNEKIKRDMIATKITHDEVIETMLVTFVTAQVHLFSRAAKELDEILRLFPAAKVHEVRSRIEGYEAQGGIEALTFEKSTAQKVFEIAVGKSVISDFRKSEAEPVTTTATEKQVPVTARVVLAVVKSEFPYKAQAADELSFEKGTIIEVLEQPAGSGWWRGCTNGKEGNFPSNYTTPVKDATAASSGSNMKPPMKSATSAVSASSFASGQVSSENKVSSPISKPPRVSSSVSGTASPASPPQPRWAPPLASNASSSSSSSSPGSRSMNFSAPVAAPPRMPPPPVVGKLVIAQFDYSAQAADELSLQKGCVVEVTDDSDSGWWEGKYGGKKGIFPANYVKPK